jgi:ABC-type iron transport system FetAB permease component
MEQWVKLVGVFGIVGVMFYVSYLFYDKNQIISIILFLVAIILAIYVVISEEEMKRKRHDAPWNFEEYKGE